MECELSYLAAIPLYEEEKPYKIEGHLPPGLARSNIQGQKTPVVIDNIRDKQPGFFSLNTTGFEVQSLPTRQDLYTDDGVSRHVEEVGEHLQERLSADLVHCFAYTRRRNGLKAAPPGTDARVRPHANLVHIDQTATSAAGYVCLRLKEDAARLLSGGFRYRTINVWRPLFGPLEDCPLALCDSRTCADSDLIASDFIYPHFESENYSVLPNPDHRWYYLRHQTADEVLVFTNFDSHSNTRVAHSAFENPQASHNARTRESLEMRFLVFEKLPVRDSEGPL